MSPDIFLFLLNSGMEKNTAVFINKILTFKVFLRFSYYNHTVKTTRIKEGNYGNYFI